MSLPPNFLQTVGGQISLQSVLPEWHSDCPARDDVPMGGKFIKTMEGLDKPPSYSHAASPLSPGGPNHRGSLLSGALPALHRRPALMSTFRLYRARGIFYG